jgi:all-trans-8'-apo-beta-carotenal 15,15'-oxygenase
MLCTQQTLSATLLLLACSPISFAFVHQQRQTTFRTNLLSTTEEAAATSRSTDDESDILYDKQAWINGFDNVEHESCYELDGDFPKDIQGTHFQNGHTKFYVNKEENIFHVHPFDADGMITAVTFDNGKAWFRNRYVETKGYLEEKEAGKVLYRGVFGTARNGGKWWSNIFDIATQKNVANTHVLFQPNESRSTHKSNNGKPRMYALWEGGLPHEIDPVTLETIGGETTLDDTLDERYAAHYKIDPFTNTVCNFCINVNPPSTHTIQVMEHDRDTMELVYKKDYPGFPGIGLSHDCAITKDYFVFLQTQTKFDPLPFVLGKKGPAECIENDPEATTSSLILIPRGREQKEPIIIETPKMFTFHLSNAFQDEATNELVADMILADSMMMGAPKDSDYPDRPIWETFDFDNGLKYQLRRVRVDLNTKSFKSMKSMTDGIANCEFPIINPSVVGQDYQYAYVGASNTRYRNGVVQGVAKVDVKRENVVQQWKPERHEFVGEVCFVARDNAVDEDDGYLMAFLFNGKEKTSELVIFDAKSVQDGPFSRTKLDYMINFALHGTWVPKFTPPMTQDVVDKFADL